MAAASLSWWLSDISQLTQESRHALTTSELQYDQHLQSLMAIFTHNRICRTHFSVAEISRDQTNCSKAGLFMFFLICRSDENRSYFSARQNAVIYTIPVLGSNQSPLGQCLASSHSRCVLKVLKICHRKRQISYFTLNNVGYRLQMNK